MMMEGWGVRLLRHKLGIILLDRVCRGIQIIEMHRHEHHVQNNYRLHLVVVQQTKHERSPKIAQRLVPQSCQTNANKRTNVVLEVFREREEKVLTRGILWTQFKRKGRRNKSS